MNVSAKAAGFDENYLWVELVDGRVIGAPLSWFPRLLHASEAQRAHFEITQEGLRWHELDEDVFVAGLLAGGEAAVEEQPRRSFFEHLAEYGQARIPG